MPPSSPHPRSGGVRVGPVHLAWAEAIAPPDGTASDERARVAAALSPGQRRRLDAASPAEAQRYIRGRLLLLDLVEVLAPGVDVILDARCDRCGGEHGRPVVRDAPLAVSLASSGSFVVAAATLLDGIAAIGVDVERRRGRPLDLARLFPAGPAPDLQGWTRIEAVLKADGRGLQVPPDAVRLEGPGTGTVFPDGRRAHVPGARYGFETTDAVGPAEVALSVAVARA